MEQTSISRRRFFRQILARRPLPLRLQVEQLEDRNSPGSLGFGVGLLGAPVSSAGTNTSAGHGTQRESSAAGKSGTGTSPGGTGSDGFGNPTGTGNPGGPGGGGNNGGGGGGNNGGGGGGGNNGGGGPGGGGSVGPPLSITRISKDTGESKTDGITSDRTLRVRGEGTPGQTVRLFVNGKLKGSGRVNAAGDWSVLMKPLGDGDKVIEARMQMGRGLRQTAHTMATIDTQAPPMSISLPSHTVRLNPLMTITLASTLDRNDDRLIHIDVDANRDGDFRDRGEKDFMTIAAQPGTSTVRLDDLPQGRFQLQARFGDRAGNQTVVRQWINVAMRDEVNPDLIGSGQSGEKNPGEGPLRWGGGGGGLTTTGEDIVIGEWDEPDHPNNTFGQANIIPLQLNRRTVVVGKIENTNDVDFFRFYVPERAGLFIDTDAREHGLSNLDSIITLYDVDTNPMQVNDDGYDFVSGYPAQQNVASGQSGDSALYEEIPAGTYFVRVSAFGTTTGGYTLNIVADNLFHDYVPEMSSKPDAPDTIYLDFNGHASLNDQWAQDNGPYNAPAYDINGRPFEFSPGERLAIRNMWRVMAEDFSPFNVNVTTVQPPASSLTDRNGMRVVVTNDDGSIVGVGAGVLGIAYLDSYATGGVADQLCWVFAGNFGPAYSTGSSSLIMAVAAEMGNTGSHEAGHTFGLDHYTAAGQEVALMYTPDQGISRETWFRGDNDNGDFQDDMLIIASPTNGITFRVDDHGGTRATATPMTLVGHTYYATGIISHPIADRDMFSFVITSPGQYRLKVDVNDFYNDLDAKFRLMNAAGFTLAIIDPPGNFDAALIRNLGVGLYYIEVFSSGDPGSAGQYTVTVGPPTPPGLPQAPAGRRRINFFPQDRFDLRRENDTSDQAIRFGTLTGTRQYDKLAVLKKATGLPDYDWYQWRAGTSGTFTATIDIGRPSFGDDLIEMHLFLLNGTTLTEVDSITLPGNGKGKLTVNVQAGQIILVEVKGANMYEGVFGEAEYTLKVSL